MSLRTKFFAMTYDRQINGAEKAGLRALRERLLAGASGDVLEIGGGTGANLPCYGPAVTSLTILMFLSSSSIDAFCSAILAAGKSFVAIFCQSVRPAVVTAATPRKETARTVTRIVRHRLILVVIRFFPESGISTLRILYGRRKTSVNQ